MIDFCLQTETMIRDLSVIEHFRLISELKNTPPHLIESEIEMLLEVLNLDTVATQVS